MWGEFILFAVFGSSPIPAIPPYHVKTHHIRGTRPTAALNQCVETLASRGGLVRGRTPPNEGKENNLSLLRHLKRGSRGQNASGHGGHLDVQNASGFARRTPRRVHAPRMRAGSHERHFCAQNASGLARTQPERVQTLRMRAGSHRQHLPECERARTNGT